MIDIPAQLDAIEREVTRRNGANGEEVTVTIRRSYQAGKSDVWDALTDPERLRRWFLPIRGDLRTGGSFQLEGNAGGDILECRPTDLIRVTFGGPTSIVELRLSERGGNLTMLELEHSFPLELAQSGAGALYVGPGWDGGFVALDLYLRGEIADDPVAAANSPEGIELSRQSVDAWIDVVETSGTATPGEVETAKAIAMSQFAPGT
jgi:uncharacterized protein YndB with AHSA1/START domain